MQRIALTLAVLAATLSLAGLASAAPPEGSLHLTTVGVSDGPAGPRGFFFTENVYRGGRLVGSDRAVCRFTRRFENPRCRITISLPKGELFLFLRFTPDPRGHFAVPGGTGAYRGKTGTGIYRSTNAGTRITIWLTR